jgi:hypothetical protein
LDCQEWKDKSLVKGYEEMMKETYPTAVVTRCFAFDPPEDQADNASGLIIIPNIGNITFYMSTMMNDFANEVLTQFSVIVCYICTFISLSNLCYYLTRQIVFKV